MKKRVLATLAIALALVIVPVQMGDAGSLVATASGGNAGNSATGSGNSATGSGNSTTGSGNSSAGSNSSSTGSSTASGAEAVVSSSGASIVSTVSVQNPTATPIAVTTPESTLIAAAAIPAGNYVSVVIEGSVGEKAQTALKTAAGSAGATIAQFIDISLSSMTANGAPDGKITQLNGAIEFVVAAPESVDAKAYDFAMIRIHDGVSTILPDLDNDPQTITFATDQFSAYAIVYGARGSFDKYKAAGTGTKDSVPKTGDSFPAAAPIAMAVGLACGAAALIKRKEA